MPLPATLQSRLFSYLSYKKHFPATGYTATLCAKSFKRPRNIQSRGPRLLKRRGGVVEFTQDNSWKAITKKIEIEIRLELKNR